MQKRSQVGCVVREAEPSGSRAFNWASEQAFNADSSLSGLRECATGFTSGKERADRRSCTGIAGATHPSLAYASGYHAFIPTTPCLLRGDRTLALAGRALLLRGPRRCGPRFSPPPSHETACELQTNLSSLC